MLGPCIRPSRPKFQAVKTLSKVSRQAGNSTIDNGGGGLASAFKPRPRLRQGLPLVLETVAVVGNCFNGCENGT